MTASPRFRLSRASRALALGALALGALGLSGWVLQGCGPEAQPGPKVAPKAEVVSSVERYLPLPDGHVFSYDTFQEGVKVGQLNMSVTRPRPGRVDLKMGERVTRLQLLPQGIQDLEGGWVLKAPLELGSSWQGKSGIVKVTDVKHSLTVPAGSFSGCLETVEEGTSAEAQSKVTTVYCPDVGIVSLQIQAMQGAELLEEAAQLKSHGPRVNLDDLSGDDLPPPN